MHLVVSQVGFQNIQYRFLHIGTGKQNPDTGLILIYNVTPVTGQVLLMEQLRDIVSPALRQHYLNGSLFHGIHFPAISEYVQ